MSDPKSRNDEEWREKLNADQYRILREQGTEPPFSSPLNDNKKAGVYHCAGCGAPLFTSRAKFDSGSGWPSFWAPFEEENVISRQDSSHGMVRNEVLCAHCRGHLGHVFDDGPPPTNLRYCINGNALAFKETGEEE